MVVATAAFAMGLACSNVSGQITDVASLSPASVELFHLAMAAQQKQDFAAAERSYSLLLEDAPEFLPARFNLGLVFDAEGKTQAALDEFLAVGKRMAVFPGVQLFTGIENFRLGKYDVAEAALRIASDQSPNNANCWFWLAKTELALSHAAEGKAALDAALRISPEDPSSLYLLALMDIANQDLARGEEVLTRLVEKYPKVPEFHQSLGSVYYMQARLEKAQAEYNSQLSLDAHNPQALSMLGVILLDRGEASAAIPYLQQGLEANSRIPYLQRKLGQALFAMNQPQEAIVHLKEASVLDPQDATAHFLLWKIYSSLRDKELAAQELETFKRLQAAQPANLGSQVLLGTMPGDKRSTP